jgi:fructose-1,6-bisphosphatase/inositol monophosphatase family enzyme
MDHGTETRVPVVRHEDVNNPIDLSELLSLAVSAATRAGEAVRAHVGGRGAHASVRATAETKSSATDLVTAADRGSEQLIVDLLLSSRPHDGIVGEEGGERQGTSGIEWVIDPIDGTTNFFYGYPGFSISIAASDADGALVGVVHDPMRAETFSAVRGKGAWLNGEPLAAPSTVPPITEALVATGFSYSAELRRRQAQLLPDVLATVRDIRRGGSVALDLCYVATGRLDAFYEAMPKRWDIEAGVLVISESGRVARSVAEVLDGTPTLVTGPERLVDELTALLLRAGER